LLTTGNLEKTLGFKKKLKRRNKMKHTLKTIIRNVKSIKGNSLAEFATTTALMATLAATAAPKLSEMSEGAKGEKSRNELDKLVKQAGQFYQDTADEEGRGRFPGQERFSTGLGSPDGTNYHNDDAKTAAELTAAKTRSGNHTTAIHKDLGLVSGDEGWKQYKDAHDATWVSVFGTTNADATLSSEVSGVINDPTATAGAKGNGPEEWKALLGGETLSSKFQDGHYVYSIVAGGGSGNDVYPPVLYVADIENVTQFNNLLEP